MSRDGPLPKGVQALPRPRGGRPFRASIRRGKGVVVHLGLYETPWLAAFAYNTAVRVLNRETRPVEIPREGQPNAERVREITDRVRRRLGPVREERRGPAVEIPPEPDDLLTLFEVAIVGFWRGQAADDPGGPPGAALETAASRLVESARLLFWSQSAGHPSPLEAMTRLLTRRLDAAFGEPDLTREILDDDGDDPFRVAHWLVYPDAAPGLRFRPFRDEILDLYAETMQEATGEVGGSSWAAVLGVAPPFGLEAVRAAFRARSRSAHPDAGGSAEEFVRLREAYEEGLAYCASRPP